jgi:integrase
MRKPTNRKPIRVGAILLKEVPYKRAGVSVTRDEYRVEATWKEGRTRKKKWLMNWRAAEQFAEEHNKALEASKGKTAATFDDAAESWIQQQEARTRSKTPDLTLGVLTNRRLFAGQLRQRFGRVLLHKLELHDFEDWLLEQSAHNKRSTLQAKASVAYAILEYARKHKMCEVNPLKGEKLQLPGAETAERIEIPDHSDMDRLREYLVGEPGRPARRPFKMNRLQWSSMRVAVVLAATCGLRRGEVCGLRWDRINRIQEMAEIEVREVIAERPTRLKDRPKTPAGLRKVPLTLEVQDILSEHADLYKKHFGKIVGHVVRFDRSPRGYPFAAPTALAQAFGRIMQGAGIVDQNGRPKFSFHALRHYAASCWVTHNSTIGGILQVSKWLGHGDSKVTLQVYGHCIHDPEVHARFLRMPNWLAREVLLRGPVQPALAAPEVNGAFIEEIACPIPVPEWAETWLRKFLRDLWQHGEVNRALLAVGKGRDTLRYALKRCELPTIGELEVMAWQAMGDRASSGADHEIVAVPVVEPACPIDVPDITPSWLRVFIRLVNQGMTGEAASREIRRQPVEVRAELARLKIAPSIAELARQLRHKRIMALHEAGYQAAEVAHLVGVHVDTVARLRRELQVSEPRGGKVGPAATKAGWALRRQKSGGSKSLVGLDDSDAVGRPETRQRHKNQLKLL